MLSGNILRKLFSNFLFLIFYSLFLISYFYRQLLLMTLKPFNGPVNVADALNFTQKTSFHNGYKTVLLLPDTILWRFVSKQSDRRFGSFWMDELTMQTVMRTLQENGIFSQQYKKDNVRDSLAVLEGWSHLNWRLKIRLRK